MAHTMLVLLAASAIVAKASTCDNVAGVFKSNWQEGFVWEFSLSAPAQLYCGHGYFGQHALQGEPCCGNALCDQILSRTDGPDGTVIMYQCRKNNVNGMQLVNMTATFVPARDGRGNATLTAGHVSPVKAPCADGQCTVYEFAVLVECKDSPPVHPCPPSPPSPWEAGYTWEFSPSSKSNLSCGALSYATRSSGVCGDDTIFCDELASKSVNRNVIRDVTTYEYNCREQGRNLTMELNVRCGSEWSIQGVRGLCPSGQCPDYSVFATAPCICHNEFPTPSPPQTWDQGFVWEFSLTSPTNLTCGHGYASRYPVGGDCSQSVQCKEVTSWYSDSPSRIIRYLCSGPKEGATLEVHAACGAQWKTAGSIDVTDKICRGQLCPGYLVYAIAPCAN